MPGRSFSGALDPWSDEETALAGLLERHVRVLADGIGERHTQRPAALAAAASHIRDSLRASGLDATDEVFEADGTSCANVIAEVEGADAGRGIVVVGAHYDSVWGCPAANDNGSGVAMMLALAGRMAGDRPSTTIRFAAFVNEEPPHFQTGTMGSYVHARGCKERGEKVVAMLSLETLGFYSDDKGSQSYPAPFGVFYPSRGNFVAFVGNWSNRSLVRRVTGLFRKRARFPSEGAAPPGFVPGVGWSDHWSFWQFGYPALMATDTAPFRYPQYHMPGDTADRLDYTRMARIAIGIESVIRELAAE